MSIKFSGRKAASPSTPACPKKVKSFGPAAEAVDTDASCYEEKIAQTFSGYCWVNMVLISMISFMVAIGVTMFQMPYHTDFTLAYLSLALGPISIFLAGPGRIKLDDAGFHYQGRLRKRSFKWEEIQGVDIVAGRRRDSLFNIRRDRYVSQACIIKLSPMREYHIWIDLSPSKRALLQVALEEKGVSVYRAPSMIHAHLYLATMILSCSALINWAAT
jgi:hypothetical protein